MGNKPCPPLGEDSISSRGDGWPARTRGGGEAAWSSGGQEASASPCVCRCLPRGRDTTPETNAPSSVSAPIRPPPRAHNALQSLLLCCTYKFTAQELLGPSGNKPPLKPGERRVYRGPPPGACGALGSHWRLRLDFLQLLTGASSRCWNQGWGAGASHTKQN